MPTVNYDMSSSIQINGARNPISDVSPIDDGLTDQERDDVNNLLINTGMFNQQNQNQQDVP